jgi:hypothetical protein
MDSPDTTDRTNTAQGDAADGEPGRLEAPLKVPDTYLIPRALAQATLDYLAARPYREVFALIQAFESLEPVPGGSDVPCG